jgi:hypothetical protein
MRRINRYTPIRLQNYFHEKKEFLVNQEELEKWKSEGCPVPPPHLAKQSIIEKYAEQSCCEIFIETGTYLGDTVFSQKANFKSIISIELSKKLYKAASRRFKKSPHIKILYGNSGNLLSGIMSDINARALIWLDGHYSGGFTAKGETESPVFKELDAIFSNNNQKHVILIDDARLFIGQRDYPTMNELESYVKCKNPDYKITTESDIIVLTIPDQEYQNQTI